PVLNTISRIGDLWRNTSDANSATTPAWLLHAAEVHFLLAEAALNGWAVGGTAQGHYEAGVRAAMAMYDGADGVTLDQATVDAYLAQPGVAWGTGDSDLELIIEQKWLSLYTSGWEAYAEFRRTGYPDEIT
ncbi:MAG: SusD/RagB family nutrient-binding outer membrane lipoprotein, partial [Gammaproteobacteria bacterium]|nr:SusD/RagB family nutrient-binding outer membrane lipoprotein [Gemmatimonadota bacterium]NIR38920.1 SusD/RagB family nutrient-binding outer membrane lipoprotein [Actinomycetota bacterium]NIU76965.1 SusD/RagB family nutrient-binding outer membrane lipoprotein [Gammaproteobacteria bacterium]NIY10650.1 SusD/RagB family nutrient-binding outer membrane lipoprotein [Gemmatimonadota bacterium]